MQTKGDLTFVGFSKAKSLFHYRSSQHLLRYEISNGYGKMVFFLPLYSQTTNFFSFFKTIFRKHVFDWKIFSFVFQKGSDFCHFLPTKGATKRPFCYRKENILSVFFLYPKQEIFLLRSSRISQAKNLNGDSSTRGEKITTDEKKKNLSSLMQ